MFCSQYRHLFVVASVMVIWNAAGLLCVEAQEADTHLNLYQTWKELPEPPITPYHGPFGVEARAFVGEVTGFAKSHPDVYKSFWDWKRDLGSYDPDQDPRPINLEYEAACIEDWRRMGYNCGYKGNTFTFRSGRYLKRIGMLGAIDQTLWGNGGPPPMQFDGKSLGRKHREACGSFFAQENYEDGVLRLANFARNYGQQDMFQVGNTFITCSWDEVGMRTRGQMDYRDPMRAEFRRFLKEVWFQDESPSLDSNGDGRTYNGFTGESAKSWNEIEPLPVSLNWSQPAWKNDGSRTFSAMPEVDTQIFRQPARYKLLVDFHRYFTFEFFRRTSQEASKRLVDGGVDANVLCYPFTQHFIIWPGANQKNGNSFYWYHRLSPVVNVEHCWPDAPTMNLNYAITDRLSTQNHNLVMGWVWFYFGQEGWDMYNGPHDIDRAMVRMVAHTVDGSHHWLYSPRYRGRDRKQRLQIAYWQNFLKSHYAEFLSKSKPMRPEIALLMPDTTGYFYRYFEYPKQDFAWTADAFQQSQYPYDLLTEEELELGDTDLTDYKVLYVVGSEWSTPTIRRKIEHFLQQGGVVFANVDSLTLDVSTGKRIDFLERNFGVRLTHKYKNAFFPSTQNVQECIWGLQMSKWGSPFRLQGHSVHRLEDPRAWAKLYARTAEKYVLDSNGKPKRPIPSLNGFEAGEPVRDTSWKMIMSDDGLPQRDETVWKQLDVAMNTMPKKVLGIEQSPLNMREPPRIRYNPQLTRLPLVPTWSEIDTAEVVGDAEPIAWWGENVVGVETENTVWLGTREGMSLHALSSRMSAHRGTEPCNPFPRKIPDRYEAYRAHTETLGYAARKAGVRRPVTVSLGRRLPMNLEVLVRRRDDGTLMLFVINHDGTDETYDVTIDRKWVVGDATVWDMLAGKTVEEDSDGKFQLAVEPYGVATVLVGKAQTIESIQKVQRLLNSKDLRVPAYFIEKPELNEHEWVTPVPALAP